VARTALSFSPLKDARGTHATGIKSVPDVAAFTDPQVALRRLPAAEWTSNPRPGRALRRYTLNFGLALDDGGRAALWFWWVAHRQIIHQFDWTVIL